MSTALQSFEPPRSGSHARLARRSAWLVTALMLCLFLGASSVVTQVASTLNHDEIQRNKHLARTAGEAWLTNITFTLLDFAFWDEAYEHTHGKVDTAWTTQQVGMGRSLLSQYGLNGVFIVDARQVTRYAFVAGEFDDRQASDWIKGDLSALLAQARAKAGQRAAVTGYFLVDGRPAVVAAAAIQPLSYTLTPPTSELAYLVFVDVLGPVSLQRMGSIYGLPNLRQGSAQSPVSLQLSDDPPVYLTWDIATPGATFLRMVLPLVLLTSLIFGGGAWLLLRRSIRAAEQIDRGREAMRLSEERFRDIAEGASDWIWETDANLRLTYLSSRFRTATGFDTSQWLGKPLHLCLNLSAGVFDTLASQPEGHRQVMPCAHTDALGGQRLGSLHARAIRENGCVVGYRGTVSDVTEEAEAQARIAYLSGHDALTGLPNRGQAYRVLQTRLAGGTCTRAFAILFIDLSGFKQINDCLGHIAGDQVLVKVARRLGEALQPDDVLARLGGDEFLIITPRVTQHCLSELCEGLLGDFTPPIVTAEHELRLGLCIGIAQAPVDSTDAEELLRLADIALYEAKSRGRHGWQLYNAEMKTRIQERRQLEQDLKHAVQHDEFTVVFQPRFDITGARILGAEALVRWQHPEKGLLSPAVFIPLAEETGLIVALSDIVMRRACALVASWPEPVFVSVNLSCIEFMRSDLVARIERTLAATGLPASRLEVEVTESVMIDNADGALALMVQLKKLGVKLSMDDFGTGYSSLSYLSCYPFDGIKIDRSFVMNLSDPKANNQAIVSAVVAMGKSLGMVVTAEGVETPEQLEVLATLGCDQAQGYLLGRPMPPDALATLLLAQHAVAAQSETSQ